MTTKDVGLLSICVGDSSSGLGHFIPVCRSFQKKRRRSLNNVKMILKIFVFLTGPFFAKFSRKSTNFVFQKAFLSIGEILTNAVSSQKNKILNNYLKSN